MHVCIIHTEHFKKYHTGQKGQGRVWSEPGNRVKSKSLLSQHMRYLKAPPASFNGNSPLPDHYGAGWGSKTSLRKKIYILSIEMTERFLGCSDIFKGQPLNTRNMRWRKSLLSRFTPSYHAPTARAWKEKETLSCAYEVLRLQLKFHLIISPANINNSRQKRRCCQYWEINLIPLIYRDGRKWITPRVKFLSALNKSTQYSAEEIIQIRWWKMCIINI